MEVTSNKNTEGGKTGYKRPQKVLPPCTICFQDATGIHYGVPTCEACKAFFYRNFKRRENLICDYGNNCKPKEGNSSWCSACRMAVCIENGMSSQGIKMGRYSFEKKAKYRKEAVHTGKITKKKTVANIDLKEIIASGGVDIKNVAFQKNQEPSTLMKKSKQRISEGQGKSQTEVPPAVSDATTSSDSNLPAGNVCEMYYSGKFPSTSSENNSNNSIAMALQQTDAETDSPMSEASSPGSYSIRAVSPGKFTITNISSDSEASTLSPVALSFKGVRSDNFLPTPVSETVTPANVITTVAVPETMASPNAITTEALPQNQEVTFADPSMPVIGDILSVGNFTSALTSASSEGSGTLQGNVPRNLGGQLFMPIGGAPVRSFVPTDSPIDKEFVITPSSSLTNPGAETMPTMQVVSNRLLETHGTKFAERHQIVSTSESCNAIGYKVTKDSNPLGNCIFDANFAANSGTGRVPNEKEQDVEKDEEFEMVLKASTHSPPNQSFMLKKVLTKDVPHPNKYVMKYEISFSPNIVDFELEKICNDIDRLCISHDSTNMDFTELNQLCQKSYDQYKESKNLTDEFFGPLVPLSHEEHYELYSSTGIDIDDRYEFLRWICETYEHDLKSYIRFCKDLPEFTNLPLLDQMSLVKKAATGFFLLLDMWVVDIDNKIVTYPSETLKEVRTFHFDDLKVLYSEDYLDLWYGILKKLQSFRLTESQLNLLSCLHIHTKEFAKTDKGYTMASRLQHILAEALRHSISKTQKDPTLLPRVMRFMTFDMEHFRRADIHESYVVFNKFGAVMNVCLPLTYDIYCQDD